MSTWKCCSRELSSKYSEGKRREQASTKAEIQSDTRWAGRVWVAQRLAGEAGWEHGSKIIRGLWAELDFLPLCLIFSRTSIIYIFKISLFVCLFVWLFWFILVYKPLLHTLEYKHSSVWGGGCFILAQTTKEENLYREVLLIILV